MRANPSLRTMLMKICCGSEKGAEPADASDFWLWFSSPLSPHQHGSHRSFFPCLALSSFLPVEVSCTLYTLWDHEVWVKTSIIATLVPVGRSSGILAAIGKHVHESLPKQGRKAKSHLVQDSVKTEVATYSISSERSTGQPACPTILLPSNNTRLRRSPKRKGKLFCLAER